MYDKFDGIRRLTTKQAMEYIPCSRTVLTRLVKIPGFPVVRIGKKILIDRDELDAWLLANIGKRV